MTMHVCHVTSAHPSTDTRIFHKQCVSLAKAGYNVSLVAPGDSQEESGVHVVGIGKPKGTRGQRMTQTTKKAFDTALSLDADLYHLHDPELLPYALKLKQAGKKVIFDSHEDYCSTIAVRQWIPRPLRPIASRFFGIYEGRIIRLLDAAIVCYPWTEERYRTYNREVEMILNFPILRSDEERPQPDYTRRAVAFAGAISRQWKHEVVIQAVEQIPDSTYHLAGRLIGKYGEELQSLPGWKNVQYHGQLPLKQVFSDVYGQSSIGMALLDYIPQCRGIMGNLSNTKFFEYMDAGLPLVCTDFVLWSQVIQDADCGITVNPHDVHAVADAIRYLLDHPEEARRMGENGRRAVKEKYNWQQEEKKLLALYRRILAD